MCHTLVLTILFLSTLSLRRATTPIGIMWGCIWNFYPRSPCGERRAVALFVRRSPYFYPRSPCGERPRQGVHRGRCSRDFYPRSPCGERRCRPGNCTRCCAFLSTLSLRRATPRLSRVVPTPIFLSTLSLRRATVTGSESQKLILHFYPRSPCGERLTRTLLWRRQKLFLSTLSLRRATIFAVRPYDAPIFLSTLSLRRATRSAIENQYSAEISIHALLAESDRFFSLWCILCVYFYPRSPCGERPPYLCYVRFGRADFYPRSPCGERRYLLS